ncbi:hypothetical protein MMA24_23675, partial [Salmonella enterica]|nr:hypothetical protein [Salmonella enterica]
MDCVAFKLYACIMSSFEKKKRLVFLECDIPCRHIILSLHFFRFELFQNKDALSVGVSLQNKTRIFST